jgi:hypothetical protein
MMKISKIRLILPPSQVTEKMIISQAAQKCPDARFP